MKAERALPMSPFGTDSRKCIGRDFSVNNITLALGTLLSDWRLTPANTSPATITDRSIVEPRGLKLRLTRRHDASEA